MNNETNVLAVEEHIAGEQLRMVFRHLLPSVPLPIMAAFLIAFIMRDQVSHDRLWMWCMWVTVSYLTLPTAFCYWYGKTGTHDFDNRKRGYAFAAMAFTTAASWGGAGILLYVPDSLIHQVLLGGILYTAAAGVMVTTFPYTLGYYAGVTPILLPVAFSYAQDGGAVQYAMAGMILMTFLMLAYFQNCMQRSLTQSLSMRFELERLNAQLEMKNAQITTLSCERQRVFAAANHDLRQPLHALRLLVSALGSETVDHNKARLITSIRQSIESMSDLLNELMEIARLDMGAIKVSKRDFPMQDVLDRLHNAYFHLATDKGLKFRIVPCARIVYSDPVLVERILGNLLHNAIRYTDAGAVMLVCRHHGGALAVQVRDSGEGIPEAEHQAVFEEFTQLNHAGNSKGKGVGLGLAIVSRLTRMLDNSLQLTSRPGIGTIFTLTLPIGSEIALSKLEMDGNPSHRDRWLAPATVLIVEDDEPCLVALRMLLCNWGCDVECARDFAQASAVLERRGTRLDVVISDYHLPGGNGLDVMRVARTSLGDRVRGIIVTANASPDIVRGAQSLGCIVMHKPVNEEALYALLDNMLCVQQA